MYFSDKFIGANTELCDYDNHVPAPYLRKSFDMDFTPEKAEIVLTGIGFYELYINGTRVSKGEMAPYITNADDVCFYDCFELLPYLKKGKNCIGILLGNGFRNAFGGDCWQFEKGAGRGPVAAALYFCASGEGKVIEFEGDSEFKTHPSPILYNDIRMGYIYDSRLEIPNWADPQFDDSRWNAAVTIPSPNGEKCLCTAAPVRVVEELSPVDIKHFDILPYMYEDTTPTSMPLEGAIRENVYLYDFGVNGAGVTVLRVNGKAGQRITVRHGEYYVDGRFSINNIINRKPQLLDNSMKYLQADTFICKGGYEEFIPRFKYDGFRYAYVEGLEPEQATAEALTFRVMSTIGKRRADFECSDYILNRLYEMTIRSDVANFYYFPTDCPHREKNGWTGDASLSAEQLLLNFDIADSLKEWLRCIRTSQRSDGAIPGIVPTYGWGFAWGNGPSWDSVMVDLPYYIYKYDRDIDVICENANMIVKYLRYAKSRLNENGLAEFGLGDWNAPDSKKTAPLIVTDCLRLYETAKKAEGLFKIAGLEAEEEIAADMADGMLNAILGNLIDENCVVKGNCQTSQAYALSLGVFDCLNKRDQAQEVLRRIIERDGSGEVNTCGVIGMRHIFHVLAEMGEVETAFKLITSTHHTCYGGWVLNGDSTLRENFKPVGHETFDSLNHHYMGDIASWLIRRVAGLCYGEEFDSSSFIEVKPQFIACLSYAKAYYDSKDGRCYSEWRRVDGGVTVKIIVPEGYRVRVILPEGYGTDDGSSFFIEGGETEFYCKNQK